MLKIVDYYPNTKKPFPLKELKKFGFGTCFEGPSREPESWKLAYYDRTKTQTFENVYGNFRNTYKIVRVYVDDRTIHFFNLSGEVYNKNWANDLIKADLVEKVEE